VSDPAADLTLDAFLGGRLHIWQPRAGYRAAMDPVLLSAAVPAAQGQRVLELGCGVGVASLCLGRRVPGLILTGVERQPAYAALARRNAEANGIALRVIEADLADPPPDLRAESFDQVLANPPYFPPGSGTLARDPGREAAQREDTPLAAWVDAGLRRLVPHGRLTLIQAADRLGAILAAIGARGSVTVLPVAARAGRPAARVIVQARKGDRRPFALLAPLILHEGERHLRDGDDHSPVLRRILREGGGLPLGSPSTDRQASSCDNRKPGSA
jgi:tRNA1(Val) A37 N6-methylase TrmN6